MENVSVSNAVYPVPASPVTLGGSALADSAGCWSAT
jgi:hypothetical protein